MLLLLLMRATPLILRPLIVLAEGYFLLEYKILPFVIPASMLALTISSVPVHRDFYKFFSVNTLTESVRQTYFSAIFCLLSISLVILCCFLLFSGKSSLLVLIVGSAFVVEKFFDEISRFFEFDKKFWWWSATQIVRSVWYSFPLIFFLLGFGYLISFALTAIVMSTVSLLAFVLVFNVGFFISGRGLATIRSNILYSVGSLLPAFYQQAPRLVVAEFFPMVSHIYLASSQISAAVGLLFSVKFQIPYRKIISRKTHLVYRRTSRILKILLFIAVGAILVYLLPIPNNSGTHYSNTLLFIILIPLMTSVGVVGTVLSIFLDYVFWSSDRVHALKAYCISILFAFAVLSVYLSVFDHQSMFQLVAVCGLIGVCWVLFIEFFCFGGRN